MAILLHGSLTGPAGGQTGLEGLRRLHSAALQHRVPFHSSPLPQMVPFFLLRSKKKTTYLGPVVDSVVFLISPLATPKDTMSSGYCSLWK